MVNSVRLSDGAVDTVAIEPTIVGPGESFDLTLTFRAGVGGFYELKDLLVGGTGDLTWAEKTYPWPVRNAPPARMSMPADSPLMPVSLTYKNIEIPERPSLDDAVIALRFVVRGKRPILTESNRIEKRTFAEPFEATLHLSHGTIVPTGWTNFHAYNRQAWGTVVLTCLPVIYAITYLQPRRKYTYLPDALPITEAKR